jgi:hypothetical protein
VKAAVPVDWVNIFEKQTLLVAGSHHPWPPALESGLIDESQKKYINGYISGKEHICFVYHTTWNLAHSNHPRLGGAWLHDKRTSEWVQTS